VKKYPLYILVCLLVLFSCKEQKDNQEQFTKQHIKIILDSIGEQKIIACFNEDNSLSVLELENKERKIVRKLIFRIGYPIFSDSLVYVKTNQFKSSRTNTIYFIKDSSVISINYVKIIHPSSNWQGQTPWAQPYVNTYKRLDIKTR
jgi:hypothetical protein